MGEETQKGQETGSKPVDLTLFRSAQRDLSQTASDQGVLEDVVNEDIKSHIEGEVDQDLFETVEEYIEIIKEPYAVKYFKAAEIFNGLTEGDFESIDGYILDKIKNSNQKTTFEVYEKILKALEESLSISEDHETMHRIVQIVKFIEHGTQRVY